MIYRFISINEFLKEFEIELANFLYDYDLTNKFCKNAKKVVLYFFIKKINNKLKEHDIILYHNHLIDETYTLYDYYPKEDFDKFIDKICSSVKKLTKRLIFIKPTKKIPSKATINEMDGGIIDELILLDQQDIDLKKLKEFLEKCKLKDLFSGISMHISI